MRILHVTDCYLPRVGGIELHVRDLVAHQRLAGDDARVVTLTPVPVGSAPDPQWVSRIHGRGSTQPPGLRHAAAYLNRVLQVDRVDVVHVHVSVLSPFATLAARQVASRGLPTLVTVHSMSSGLGPLPTVARDLLGL